MLTTRVIAAMLLICGGMMFSGPSAVASGRPVLHAGTPLVMHDAANAGFLNLRERPEPRAPIVAKVLPGATGLSATGLVTQYGDTWWVEVTYFGMTGWANARLLANVTTSEPLQVFVNIDDLPEILNRAFSAAPFRRSSATSYEECARACVQDLRCRAIDYSKASSDCRFFSGARELTERQGASASSKPRDVDAQPSAAPAFEQRPDQRFDGKSYREIIAVTFAECASECANDRACAAIEFQPRRRVCAQFAVVGKTSSRSGYEVGIKPVGAPLVAHTGAGRSAPTATESRSAHVNTAVRTPSKFNYSEAAQLFHSILDGAVAGEARATGDLSPSGRISFSWMPTRSEASGSGTRVGGAASLEGDAIHLQVKVASDNPRRVDLVFARHSGEPERIGSTTHQSPRAADAFAAKLKGDLDRLARLTAGEPGLPQKAGRRR